MALDSLSRLSQLCWFSVCKKRIELFQADWARSSWDRLGWVKFDDKGGMVDDANSCWVKACFRYLHDEWNRLFQKLLVVLDRENILDSRGYLKHPLMAPEIKRIHEELKKDADAKKPKVEEDDIYDEVIEVGECTPKTL